MSYTREEYLSDLNSAVSVYQNASEADELLETEVPKIAAMRLNVTPGEGAFKTAVAIYQSICALCNKIENLGYATPMPFIAVNDMLDETLDDILADIFGPIERKIERDLLENQHLGRH